MNNPISIKNLDSNLGWAEPKTESLIEQLFSNICSADLVEGLKFNYNNMKPGDIYLVKAFDNNGDTVDNREHRILLVNEVPANKRENNEYLGYYFTTNLDQATVNNPKRIKNILIDNYDSILETGESVNKPVVLSLARAVSFKLSDLAKANYSLLGHVTDSFMRFVKDVMSNKMDASTLRWDTETANKYSN